MAFVRAHFCSPHSCRRLDFHRQDTRANNTLSEPARRLRLRSRKRSLGNFSLIYCRDYERPSLSSDSATQSSLAKISFFHELCSHQDNKISNNVEKPPRTNPIKIDSILRIIYFIFSFPWLHRLTHFHHTVGDRGNKTFVVGLTKSMLS